MKTATTGTISGCIVWVIAFAALSACLLPVAMFVGSFTSGSDLTMQTLGPYICPEGSLAESYSYQTTSYDEYGAPSPATATELHCVDSSGNVVKTDPVGFAFIWVGLALAIGCTASIILAFFLAAPAGAIIANLIKRISKKPEENIG